MIHRFDEPHEIAAILGIGTGDPKANIAVRGLQVLANVIRRSEALATSGAERKEVARRLLRIAIEEAPAAEKDIYIKALEDLDNGMESVLVNAFQDTNFLRTHGPWIARWFCRIAVCCVARHVRN
jgi:hypothetical protein